MFRIGDVPGGKTKEVGEVEEEVEDEEKGIPISACQKTTPEN